MTPMIMTNHGSKATSHRVAGCLVAIALAGCSGIPTYPNTLAKNLNITTRVKAASGRTAVAFDIHRVNARCETEHQGRINLEDGATAVGIPVGEPLFLDFIFASKGFLSSSVSATRYSTLLTPRSGYRYSAQVKYDRGIYDVVIRETRRRGSAGRVIDRVPLSACKAK